MAHKLQQLSSRKVWPANVPLLLLLLKL